MKHLLLILMWCSTLLGWGWDTHRYINNHAVDYLPGGMSFFQNQRDFLEQHAVDPDTDKQPGYYHYIDIDFFPEFFSGTLPHDLDSLLMIYDFSVVQSTGVVPWVVEEWTDSLSILMADGQWDDAWQVAAELGHYVADSHQPLHLTVNYNGQLTGNHGIHSRYETHMINPHLSRLPLASGDGIYWPTIIDSVFLYIEEIYPYVDDIIIADDLAIDQDPAMGDEYYYILWQELEPLTTVSIHKAIIDLASIWRTAWENAGSPSPLALQSNDSNPGTFLLANNYPNPFNPSTTIEYTLSKPSEVDVSIYNSNGQKVETLLRSNHSSGKYQVTWNGSGHASGVYLYQIKADNFFQSKKMLLIK